MRVLDSARPVVAIVSSGFKTNDDVIQFKGIELG